MRFRKKRGKRGVPSNVTLSKGTRLATPYGPGFVYSHSYSKAFKARRVYASFAAHDPEAEVLSFAEHEVAVLDNVVTLTPVWTGTP